jgi:RNA polymerase sigma-70 factor (ECF subfamily)
MADSREPPTHDPVLRAYFDRRANLVRFFAAKAGSIAAAEDLAQDLYLKLAARPTEGEVQNPVGLLYRIAANLMLDRARGDRRAAERDAAWRTSHRVAIGRDEIADEPLADHAVASRQELARLIQAAAELPPQMGRAFRLHKLEGLSQAETARVMGLSLKAVEKHVSAALKALTRRLAP